MSDGQVGATACCIINDVSLGENLEAKPRDGICQRAAHLFPGGGASVRTGSRGVRSLWVCACVWRCSSKKKKKKMTFKPPYPSPWFILATNSTLPAHFVTLPFILIVRLYAALSDNTLEAILELISLIANKQHFFLPPLRSRALHFRATPKKKTHQCIEENVGPANEKNAKMPCFQDFFSPLLLSVLYGERIITAEAGGKFTFQNSPAPMESISPPVP